MRDQVVAEAVLADCPEQSVDRVDVEVFEVLTARLHSAAGCGGALCGCASRALEALTSASLLGRVARSRTAAQPAALPSLVASKGVCTGCLGNGACWICDGRGCSRCRSLGTCHLCTGTGRRPAAPTPAQREAPGARAPRA